MAQPSDKISQFWKELKRRKVIKVLAMYAGAAYVLIGENPAYWEGRGFEKSCVLNLYWH